MNLKFGKITEVDAAKGLAKVTFEENDNLVTRFLPMSMPKTMQDKFIIPFDINEHVWCIMDEFCEDGVIGGAIYDANNLPDGGATGKTRVKFVPNLTVEYDRNSQTLSIIGDTDLTINLTGDVNVNCDKAKITSITEAEIIAPVIKLSAANVQVSGTLTAGAIATSVAGGGPGTAIINGDITVTGIVTGSQVKEGTIRLGTHKHTGVQTGAGISGTPTP